MDSEDLLLAFELITLSGSTSVLSYTLIKDKIPLVNEYNDYKLNVSINKEAYKNEIEEYNNWISKYCQELKKLNLTDLELFVKLIYDLRENNVYDNNTLSLAGFERILLYYNKRGCCRHFADDITAKLNCINPKYNARNVYVYVKNVNSNTYVLPKKRKKAVFYKGNVKVTKENKTVIDEKEFLKYGNHVVCAADIPNKNITIMIDPTNFILGYFKGKDVIVFGKNKTGYKYDKKKKIGYKRTVITNYERNSLFDILKNELKNSLRILTSNEKINRLYGKEAQKRACESFLYIDQDEKLGYQKSL